MELTHYIKVYRPVDKPGRVLLLATRRCAILECSDTFWERVRTGNKLTDDEVATLTRLGVLVPDRAAETEERRSFLETISAKTRHFAVTATMTLDCNLACPYCFEDPFRGHLRMSGETADLLVRSL